jgi:hypothetical protein
MSDTANLCLYWRFSDVQKTQVLDLSTCGNNGTLIEGAIVSGSPLQSNDPIGDEDEWGEKIPLGHALNGGIECQSVQGMNSLRHFTIEFFVRRSRHGDNPSPVKLVSLDDSVSVSVGGTGTVTLSLFGESIPCSRRIPLNQWVHVALVSSSNKVSMYMDGFPALTGVDLAPCEDRPLSFRIGHAEVQTTEVRLWSTMRTVQQLKEFMHHPLPRMVPVVSKWKGLKIQQPKSSANASIRSTAVVPPSPLTSVVGPPRTRRINESIVETASVARSRRNSMTVLPGADGPVPVISTEEPLPEAQGDIPVSPLKDVFSPKVRRVKTLAEAPLVIHAPMSEAMDKFDSSIQSGVDLFREERYTDGKAIFQTTVDSVSLYMINKYKFGRFLAPFPGVEVLDRLRVLCRYLCACTILERGASDIDRILLVLRIPLLHEDVLKMTQAAIRCCAKSGDILGEFALNERFLSTFQANLDGETVERIRMRIALLRGRIERESVSKSKVACQLCHSAFKDPLQSTCEVGCKTRFTVDFVDGVLVPADEALECAVCQSTLLCRTGGYIIYRPSNRTIVPPNLCPLCHCGKSLRPLELD